MKNKVSYLLLLWFIPFSNLVLAQENSTDVERIQRDIRIMERALEELFRTENQQRFSVNLPGFMIGGGTGIDNIKGHYLKGYGVIFTIPDITKTTYGFINWSDSDDQDHPEIVFSNDINDTGISINEESIKTRITEFLVNYAPSIHNMELPERVTLTLTKAQLDRYQEGLVSREEALNLITESWF